jgi:tetratricopeptide (TPR) repeat protein
MGQRDWYRNTTWTPKVESAFRARLKRSRGTYHKAQYLRIQAYHLAEVGNHLAALSLLDELLSQYPDSYQVAWARSQRAQCLLSLGRIEEAVDEYRRSLQAERAEPTCRSDSWLDIACLIAFHGLKDHYAEALSILEEFATGRDLLFAVQRFQFAAARAFIADDLGDQLTAREYAQSAMEHAAAEHSGFLRHPKLGLVDGLDQKLQRRLARIAGGPEQITEIHPRRIKTNRGKL